MVSNDSVRERVGLRQPVPPRPAPAPAPAPSPAPALDGPHGGVATAERLLDLQATIGNQAVLRMLGHQRAAAAAGGDDPPIRRAWLFEGGDALAERVTSPDHALHALLAAMDQQNNPATRKLFERITGIVDGTEGRDTYQRLTSAVVGTLRDGTYDFNGLLEVVFRSLAYIDGEVSDGDFEGDEMAWGDAADGWFTSQTTDADDGTEDRPDMDDDDASVAAEEDGPGVLYDITIDNYAEVLDLPSIRPDVLHGDPELFYVLRKILSDLLQSKGPPWNQVRVTEEMVARWSTKIHTRAELNELVGIDVDREGRATIRRMRTPGTKSGPKGYTGSNNFKYKHVTYQLDSTYGSIDFKKPTDKTAQTKWTNPVVGGRVALDSGTNCKPGKGRIGGKWVPLKKATRAQHFAIANRIVNNNCGSHSPPNLTWHHLTKKYEMVLVDRMVHAQHGHNGGILVWGT